MILSIVFIEKTYIEFYGESGPVMILYWALLYSKCPRSFHLKIIIVFIVFYCFSALLYNIPAFVFAIALKRYCTFRYDLQILPGLYWICMKAWKGFQ